MADKNDATTENVAQVVPVVPPEPAPSPVVDAGIENKPTAGTATVASNEPDSEETKAAVAERVKADEVAVENSPDHVDPENSPDPLLPEDTYNDPRRYLAPVAPSNAPQPETFINGVNTAI